MGENRLEVLWVARYDYQPGWRLREHRHEYYQIIYILDGRGQFILDGQEYTMEQNMVFIIKSGTSHELITSDHTVKTLDVKFLLQDPFLRMELEQCMPVMQSKEPLLKLLFEKIREEGIGKRKLYKAMSNLYMEQMLLTLLRLEAERRVDKVELWEQEDISGKGNSAVASVMNYIHNNYQTPVTLQEMAAYAGYNKNYLCEAFKKATGYTPVKYLYFLRIRKARDLIRYSDYSLKEIAAMTGFETIHHFTRLFRQQEGVAPGDWRRRERDGVRKDIYLNENFINKSMIGESR